MGKGRAPCCDKSQVKRGPWSPSEDAKLISYIQRHGHENWRALPKLAGLARCGKSCRLRWVNYLSPDVKRGNFTREEEDSIIRLQKSFGNRWSKIASYLPGRTDNEIKNVWNTYLRKRMLSYNVSPDSAGDESKRESCVTSASSSPSSSFAALGDMEINPGNYKGEGTNKQGRTGPQNKPSSSGSNGSVVNTSTISVEAKAGNHDGEQNVDSFLNVTEEVNKPDGASGKIVDNPFEGSDTEFWSMLGGLATSPKATELIDQILDADAYQDIDFGGHQDTNGETGNDQWLQYLERELGLVSPPPPMVDFDDPNWTRLNYN